MIVTRSVIVNIPFLSIHRIYLEMYKNKSNKSLIYLSFIPISSTSGTNIPSFLKQRIETSKRLLSIVLQIFTTTRADPLYQDHE